MTTIAIADLATRVASDPAPVLLLDTCNLLDLLRAPVRGFVNEIEAAVQIRSRLTLPKPGLWVCAAEFVPLEWAANVGVVESEQLKQLAKWDEVGAQLLDAVTRLGQASPVIGNFNHQGMLQSLRQLAQGILDNSFILGRDATSISLAIARLLAKRPPAQNKQFKDSVILEQYLAFIGQLRKAGFNPRCVFVSSNRTDFGAGGGSPNLHPDLEPEFQAIRLEYFPTLHAAVNSRDTSGLPLLS